MTRFARAKGSKSSNERIPEEATSWSDMKRQLLEKNKKVEDVKKKQEADKQKVKNYKTFLQNVEEEQSKIVKWAEFPTDKPKNNNETGKKKKATLKILKEKSEAVIKRKSEESDNVEEPVKKQAKKSVGPTPEETANKSVKKKTKKRKNQTPTNPKSEENNTQTPEKTGKKRKKPNKNPAKSEENNGQTTNDSQTSEDTLKKSVKKKRKKGNKNQTPTKVEEPATTVPKDDTQTPAEEKKKVQKKMKKQNKNQKKIDKKPKKPVDISTLPEEERKKIEKKQEKKMRQVEKRKQFKSSQNPARRRKNQIETISVNGIEIDLAYVDGFPVKKEDADRLQQLRKEMISKGLPRSEIKIALKLERRKAEKALAREKKKVCFNCRKSGHNLSECPDLEKQMAESSGTGICFKCGSTEHTHFECKVVRGQEFKFAQCFICHEQGHIARQCPDNARGLYPKGGACRVCGDVTHLKKDCPKYQAQQQQLEQGVHVETITEGDNPDNLGGNGDYVRIKEQKPVNKVVKF